MTDEQLDAIDTLIGQTTYCDVLHPEVDLLSDVLREQGFTSYAALDPFKIRRAREKSLWVRKADGRCVPELYALAVIKFGVLTQDKRPFWTDGSAEHNEIDNISLSTPVFVGKYRKISQQKSRWNDPVGRIAHRETAKASAKRKRESIRAARASLKGNELQDLIETTMPPDGRKGEDDDRDISGLSLDDMLKQVLAEKANELAGQNENEAADEDEIEKKTQSF